MLQMEEWAGIPRPFQADNDCKSGESCIAKEDGHRLNDPTSSTLAHQKSIQVEQEEAMRKSVLTWRVFISVASPESAWTMDERNTQPKSLIHTGSSESPQLLSASVSSR